MTPTQTSTPTPTLTSTPTPTIGFEFSARFVNHTCEKQDIGGPDNPPVSVNNTELAVRDICNGYTEILPSFFTYTDSEGDPLTAVKITSLPSIGTLKFNGVNVNVNDIFNVNNNTFQDGVMTYHFDGTTTTGYNVVIGFMVKTTNYFG
jgi:hypothetical protein